MSNEDYRRALEAASRELEALTSQRADLDRRIAQLTQTTGNLMRLCGLAPSVCPGLTDSCRLVLRCAGHPLTAVEVRAQLAAMGIDLSKYSNDLAAIHTILKRLNEAGEVRFVPRTLAKPGYQWTRAAVAGVGANTLVTEPREAKARPRRKKDAK
jgi:hypothetical protein